MATLENQRPMNKASRKILLLKLIVVGAACALAVVQWSGYFVGAAAAPKPVTPEAGTIARVPNPPLASDLVNLPGDLRSITVPEPGNLGDFVSDANMARALGKALFWDMQV